MNIRNKTIKFDMYKNSDHELWEWLQKLPHGDFSKETKEYWMKKMKEDKGNVQS